MFWAVRQRGHWPKVLTELQALGVTRLITQRKISAAKGRRNDDVMNILPVSAVVNCPSRTRAGYEAEKVMSLAGPAPAAYAGQSGGSTCELANACLVWLAYDGRLLPMKDSQALYQGIVIALSFAIAVSAA